MLRPGDRVSIRQPGPWFERIGTVAATPSGQHGWLVKPDGDPPDQAPVPVPRHFIEPLPFKE